MKSDQARLVVSNCRHSNIAGIREDAAKPRSFQFCA